MAHRTFIREGSKCTDLLVPDSAATGGALFRYLTPGLIECTADILGFTISTMSREEELDATEHDEHGRFQAAQSSAHRNGYLQRPVIDEYGLALEEALTVILPQWNAMPRRLRVKLTHDVDLLGAPFSLKATAGHVIRRRRPLAALRDIAAMVTPIQPAYLRAVQSIAERSIARGLDSAIYWKASNRTPRDTGYDPNNIKVRRVAAWADRHGIEMGLHPGYFTFASPAALDKEVNRIRRLLGSRPIGGRQHYLRWSPDTWLHWEQAGLAYDSTVGYADQPGFRSGTCVPYHPWLFREGRESALLEIPLIVMDGTLVDYMKLAPNAGSDLVRNLVQRCASVGGVFTLLWHNSSLLEPEYEAMYGSILDALTGYDRYDWKADLGPFPLPICQHTEGSPN